MSLKSTANQKSQESIELWCQTWFNYKRLLGCTKAMEVCIKKKGKKSTAWSKGAGVGKKKNIISLFLMSYLENTFKSEAVTLAGTCM